MELANRQTRKYDSEQNNKRQKKFITHPISIINSKHQKQLLQHTLQMKKSLKVKRLIDENGIQVQNFTLVLRLKKIIQDLNLKIQQQDQTIMQLKRDSKTTKINEMQVEIQHLNDQNKRLVLLIEEIKQKYHRKDPLDTFSKYSTLGSVSYAKTNDCLEFMRKGQFNKSRQKKKKSQNKKDATQGSMFFGSGLCISSQVTANSKKSYQEAQKEKEEQMREQIKQRKFQKKYYELLEETEKLKKELINLRLNDQLTMGKKRRSCVSIDKGNAFFEKNMECLEKVTQKKHDLQVENGILKGKLQLGEKRIKEIQCENQAVCRVVQNLKNQLKHKTLMQSDREIHMHKSQRVLLKDLSNCNQLENKTSLQSC